MMMESSKQRVTQKLIAKLWLGRWNIITAGLVLPIGFVATSMTCSITQAS